MKDEVRSIIYGEESRIDAFIVDQTLITVSPVWQYFPDKITRHILSTQIRLDASVISPDQHLLDLSLATRGSWGDDTPRTQAWKEFLKHAAQMGLNWEYAWTGSNWNEIQYDHTQGAKRYLSLSMPGIEANLPSTATIPLKLMRK